MQRADTRQMPAAPEDEKGDSGNIRADSRPVGNRGADTFAQDEHFQGTNPQW